MTSPLTAELRRLLPTEEAGRAFVQRHAKALLFGGDFPAACALLPIKTKRDGVIRLAFERWHDEQKLFEQTRTIWDVVLKPRQIGFSTLELARDVVFGATRPGVQVLIVSHDSALCESMFRDVTRMVDELVSLGAIEKPHASNVREVVFSHNGSAIRIVEAGQTESVADKRGRSGTIHRLHVTELAFWGAAEATMSALLGACSDDAELVIESTPNGVGNLFYDVCMQALAGEGRYRFHFFPWFTHREYRRPVPPKFDPALRDDTERKLRELGCDDEQIAWWRERVDDPMRGGLERVKQEYPIDPISCFRTPGGAYVDAETCDWLAAQVRKPLRTAPVVVTIDVGGQKQTKRLGELRVYEEPQAGEQYVVGGDVSEGIGKDESALDVMARRTGRTVATFASDSVTPGDFALVMAFAARMYGGALVAPERNKDGGTVLEFLEKYQSSVTPYRRVYTADDKREGWHTNPATRPVLFDDLAQACRDRATSSPDASFADQTRTLVRDAKGKPAAMGKGQESGKKDDRWVARAIAWQLRSRATRDEGKPPPRVGAGESSGFDGSF